MHTSVRLCAVATAVAFGGAHASACEHECGYGPPAFVYFAPPAYTYPPPYAYHGPPVSYYAPTAYGYYAPVAVYRGPRWAYGYDRYHTAPVVHGRPWRRSWSYRHHAGPRLYGPPRGYARGPVVRTWRRW